MYFSPNIVLHDTESHNRLKGNDIDLEGSMIGTDISEEFQDTLPIDVNVSPRFLKNERRGNKQGNGNNDRSIRVQPMRRNGQPLVNWGIPVYFKIQRRKLEVNQCLTLNMKILKIAFLHGLQEWFDHMEMEYLVRTNSNHGPMFSTLEARGRHKKCF
ncbi:hypothetical protein H5410_027141 [Solanum commersonii]|uniref:Uncharacterized protein n=1 Tax=Solanum commersonii TaxID=4109 RepID=A0A9J5YYE8_SOLCO|nr:hypothetical protein H5410_027141 [Solanum commersonii]